MESNERESESWIDIKDFEGKYQISNLGRIKSILRKLNSRYGQNRTLNEKFLSLNKDKNTHYVSITLSKDNKRFTKSIHRLVAQAFIPNPENKCCVNHIDGNPSNNLLTNLEWVTMKENSQHAYSKQLKRQKTSWDREEVIKLIKLFANKYQYASNDIGYNKWIEENL